ncbi:MAG: hypothetical protein WCD49_18160 [Candidatus Acidiferrales bacterium]
MKETFRILVIILLSAAWFILAAPGVFAQGSQRISAVQGDTGQAIAGANIWVCAGIVQPAYSNTPACSPAAAIYSDPMLMNPVTQPLVSDGLGNYSYFGVAGTYTEVITGPMIAGYTSTIVLPCAPSSPTAGCGGSAGNPASPSGSIQFNNIGAFSASILSQDSGATTITDSGNMSVQGAHVTVNTSSSGGYNLNVNGTGNFLGLLTTPGGFSANAESPNSAFSAPTKLFFMAAGCNNVTAGNGWQIGTVNAPTLSCQGTHTRKGVLQFARGNVAYVELELPADWNFGVNVDLKIAFTTTDSTNGHFTAWSVQTGCNSLTGASTDDPVLNAVQTVSSTIGSTAVSGGEYLALLTALNMTGCSAGNNLVLAITRNNSGADTNTDTAVAAKWAELTFGRTMNSTNR